MVTYGSSGAVLAGNGYHVTPITVNDKRPILDGWQSLEEPPAFDEYAACGIGLRCGYGDHPVYAVDVDIYDAACAEYMRGVLGAEPPARIGREPKALYLFRGLESGVPKKSTANYVEGKVEILGWGQQFVAFGNHPETKRPYRWPVPGRHPAKIKAEELPILTPELITQIFEAFEQYADLRGFTEKERESVSDLPGREYDPDNPLFEKEPIGIPLPKLKEMVECNNPDCSRAVWLNIGMALHHETSADAAGLELWDAWSAKGGKYKEGETEYYWGKFGTTSRREPLTAAYILKKYKEVTGKVYKEDGGDPAAEETAPQIDKDFFAKMNWSTERFVDNPPPREMVIEGMLPKGITGMVFSAGGVGKSTAILYMCMRIALATTRVIDFFGRGVNGGAAVILTAEDPDDEINRRHNALLAAMAEELGEEYGALRAQVIQNLYIASTFGEQVPFFVMQNDKGVLRKTVYYTSFLKRLKAIPNLQLVIIDTKTRYSPAEGEGNVIATKEITFYEAITKETGATVLLLHHTSKKSRDGSEDGQQAYRDASATFDSVRSAWYMRPLTKKELSAEGLTADDGRRCFLFENAKNSYVQRHPDLRITRVGFSYTHTEMRARGEDAEEVKDRKRQDAVDAVVTYLQEGKSGLAIQADIIRELKTRHGIGRIRAIAALVDAQTDGLIDVDDSKGGKAMFFILTDAGKKYQLEIE